MRRASSKGRSLLDAAAAYATRYLAGLATRPVAPTDEALERLATLDRPLPQSPADPRAVLEELDRVGSPATVASAGGRYFGFVIGGSLPVTLAANWLAGAWDQDAGLGVAAPGAARIEAIALRWLLDALGLPSGCAADSWALDAHKWLNVPYDSGLALCRDGAALRAAMAASAAYLVQGTGREPDDYTPELSRRARGVEIWAALASLGRPGLADLVERCCRHATRFAERLRAARYEVLNEVVLNQVLVSFGPDETTRRVIARVQTEGTCWCGGTVWHGRAAMRISVSSWQTTDQDVERSVEAIGRGAASLT